MDPVHDALSETLERARASLASMQAAIQEIQARLEEQVARAAEYERDREISLLSIREVAALMGISVRHVDAMVAQGKLPQPVRLGASRRWTFSALREWTREAQANAARPDLEDALRRRNAGRPRRIMSGRHY
ncbi:MAG: excisionase family DNA-binding protein [Gammaproteobacteria bacterium]|nr:excisionase family DNA-binding protein [Gammaproteobacteria bacterium]MDA8361609.1 excisionase family DNA-binding protein [Gammaproteobacteria bacterium]